ncbi:MAG: cupredoxin domain-containing protein [Acidimicrobiia bacterium]
MDRTRAVVLAIGLLTAGLGSVGVAAAATTTAGVEDYRFDPGEVHIAEGDRVRWVNRGEQVHTITSDDADAEPFDSGRLGKGDEYTHTFDAPGRFTYHCEVHNSMKGVVQVGEPPTTTTSSTATTTSSTTTTTGPAPTTTTTAPAPTTTTAPPAPSTTTPTTRAPSAAASPAPTPATAPTTTTSAAPTTTTTAPTTTTTAPETTTTTVAAEPGTPLGPEVPPPPEPEEADGEGDLAGDQVAAPRPEGSDGGGDPIVLLLIAAVLGAGAFGGWTLWKLRPGHSA